MTSDNMRGLFFIVKGQYRHGVEPRFKNEISGDTTYIGGFNPDDSKTPQWYMLVDNKTYHCIACGSDLKKVLQSVRTAIVKHKGVARNYFKKVSEVTSDDYYEVHYLGQAPLTHDQRVAKAEGRCPRVSPTMRCLYGEVFNTYGHHYREEIEEMEDLAYKDLKDKTPLGKAKKLIKTNKTKVEGVVLTQPKNEVKVLDTTTPKKTPPKVRLGLKKK